MRNVCSFTRNLPPIVLMVLVATLACPVFAQQSPWGNIATKMATDFTGPIARGFSLVGVVVGGLTMVFGDGHRIMGGLIFGLGLALGAPALVSWLFT